MKYSPEVQKQLDQLHTWSCHMGIHLVISNQGYSVKVLNMAKPSGSRGMKLSDLVSLHNNGPYPYLVQEAGITEAQVKACKENTATHINGLAKVPVTLQRLGAHLKSGDIIEREEWAHLRKQWLQRKEYLDGQ
ncbi:hypothetical protein VPHD239_0062 [Vibrio phage D239]